VRITNSSSKYSDFEMIFVSGAAANSAYPLKT
jgi:hypothetical protein